MKAVWEYRFCQEQLMQSIGGTDGFISLAAWRVSNSWLVMIFFSVGKLVCPLDTTFVPQD